MAKSIERMARAAMILYEPKRVSRDRVFLRHLGLTDDIIEATESEAMAMMVGFVVNQVIGRRIEKLTREEVEDLHNEIKWLCKHDCVAPWLSSYYLHYEVIYISKNIIRMFIEKAQK